MKCGEGEPSGHLERHKSRTGMETDEALRPKVIQPSNA
jgi:hypothetical protein